MITLFSAELDKANLEWSIAQAFKISVADVRAQFWSNLTTQVSAKGVDALLPPAVQAITRYVRAAG